MSSRYQNLIRVRWERRQYHYASYQKYHILWEKAYTITALERIQKIPQKRDLRESYKEYLSLKICKNSRAIADQEQETWRLTRLFYLLTAQETSDGYKPHGER